MWTDPSFFTLALPDACSISRTSVFFSYHADFPLITDQSLTVSQWHLTAYETSHSDALMHFTSVFLLFEEKSDQEKKCICLHQSQSHFQQQQKKKCWTDTTLGREK
jgi:hypothetical protein